MFCHNKFIENRKHPRLQRNTYTTQSQALLWQACETWTLTKNNEKRLRIAEKRILRIFLKILRYTTDQRKTKMNISCLFTQQYRSRINRKLEELYSHSDIIKIIKSGRRRCAGPLRRDNVKRLIKLVWEKVTEERRSLERLRRWWNKLKSDLRTLNNEGVNEIMMDRDRLNHIVKSANTNPKL